MATPNYGYEKRQRELAKKQKKEEKLRAKADRKASEAAGLSDDEHLAQAGDREPSAPMQPGQAASASS
ncbi:hypothetical protein ACT80S_06330 [Ramlibacter sp. MAHUQ-53]|uniref:hypothetical protein n=1 Tax=unclassified Ramlibacter TaxID=2617605 RepID=UPI003645C096